MGDERMNERSDQPRARESSRAIQSNIHHLTRHMDLRPPAYTVLGLDSLQRVATSLRAQVCTPTNHTFTSHRHNTPLFCANLAQRQATLSSDAAGAARGEAGFVPHMVHIDFINVESNSL